MFKAPAGYTRVVLVIAALALVVTTIVFIQRSDREKLTTTTVERGTVRELVSVSGMIEATETAELTFPSNGLVHNILVERGDAVQPGDLLGIVGDAAVVAERNQAAAALEAAQAARDEIVAGQTAEAAAVTATTVANAEAALKRAQELAREQVANALAALLSNDLTALSTDGDEDATAPTVSGTYSCSARGSYVVEVYASDTESGYSYRLSGLETDTQSVTTAQPSPMGDCGLYLQFTAGDKYNESVWKIDVPNTRSATYVTRQNAYQLALTQAQQNVQAARDALALARDKESVDTAGARVEALLQANAAVQEAAARVQQIDARLADHYLTAPFSGIVTKVHLNEGEVANLQPAISLLSTATYELVARVPEIDVTKLAIDQPVTAVFDAKRDQVVSGYIDYIAPRATEIDGVGYFETVIQLLQPPEWIRAGLNADIDIITTEVTDVARLPQRFINYSSSTPTVRVVHDGTVVAKPITLGVEGNDGYVEVVDLAVGTTVVAP